MRIKKNIEIKETTNSNKFLGLQINRAENATVLSQKNYVLKILEKFNMHDCNSVRTPSMAGGKATRCV